TFIRANPDFDMEEEITKGNVAVGLLVGTIVYSASQILMAGTDSSFQMIRMHILVPTEANASLAGRLDLADPAPVRAAVAPHARGQGAAEGQPGRRHPALERRARVLDLYKGRRHLADEGA